MAPGCGLDGRESVSMSVGYIKHYRDSFGSVTPDACRQPSDGETRRQEQIVLGRGEALVIGRKRDVGFRKALCQFVGARVLRVHAIGQDGGNQKEHERED